MLFFGMVIGGFFIVSLLGGTTSMFQQLSEVAPQNLHLHEGDWMRWVAMFFITPIGVLMSPHMFTRMFAVKSSKVFNLMPFLIGFVAIAYIGSMLVGNSARIITPDIASPDRVFPTILMEYAPFVFAVILISCGATAAMSTANSQVHSMASVYALDFHKKYINKNANEKQTIMAGRYAILIFSAVAYLMCIFAPGYLITIGLFSLSGTAQALVPTLGAFFWKRSTKQGATAGMLVGFISIVAFQYGWIPAPGPFAAGGGGLLGLILNLVVFVVVSLCTKPRPEKLIDEINEQYKGYYEVDALQGK
jgi:SSS family solute:Na+ symporter